jgi:phosphoribosylformimino-5-aminoimidazole carboxamide ribotide isomerase
MFELIPAIDLRGGKCVRLTQGDYNQETVYGEDPVEVARQWQAQGAPRIHVVDLDGAVAGVPTQLDVVHKIVDATSIPIELGGGIRTPETVEQVLATGVTDVILGTSVIQNPGFLEWCLKELAEHVIVGLDARDGRVAVRGWLDVTDVSVYELAGRLTGMGARRVIFTDIAQDGMLDGPNIKSLSTMMSSTTMEVIASGGVSTVEQILAVKEAGAAGAIVGKALYVGSIRLPGALAALNALEEQHAQ